MKLSAPLFFLLISCVMTVFGAAEENPLSVELVAESTAIQPGRVFRVGLYLQHPPGYHSYWKFAGTVGIPTSIEWNLPPGWKAGAIEWPAPERVMMFQIKAQGYHGEKLLPIQLTPPKDLIPGSIIRLEGKARWMCCGRNCNPGFKDVSIELPVSAVEPAPDARWNGLLSKNMPAAAVQPANWQTRAELKKNEVIFHLIPVSDAAKKQFTGIMDVKFFTEDGLTDPNRPESFIREEAELLFIQSVSEFAPKPLPRNVIGILQTPEEWLPGMTSIRVSIPLNE